MTTGVLLRVTPANQIVERTPIWPWPTPGEYPRTCPSGDRVLFFPAPYYRFPLNSILQESSDANNS